MPKISMTLDKASIADAQKQLQAYKTRLHAKGRELTKRLAEEGLEVARIRFMTARYDGVHDVATSVREGSPGRFIIEARGQSVLFIEFGTGVMNPEHPQADELGMHHGEYGKGQGKLEQWGYYGAGGTHGRLKRQADGEDSLYLTKGNPPAMAMWDAARHIEKRLLAVAREVFTGD